jgi:hypothetical protein
MPSFGKDVVAIEQKVGGVKRTGCLIGKVEVIVR